MVDVYRHTMPGQHLVAGADPGVHRLGDRSHRGAMRGARPMWPRAPLLGAFLGLQASFRDGSLRAAPRDRRADPTAGDRRQVVACEDADRLLAQRQLAGGFLHRLSPCEETACSPCAARSATCLLNLGLRARPGGRPRAETACLHRRSAPTRPPLRSALDAHGHVRRAARSAEQSLHLFWPATSTARIGATRRKPPRCAGRVRTAAKERQVRKAAGVLLLSFRIGQEFLAMVTGASPKGT